MLTQVRILSPAFIKMGNNLEAATLESRIGDLLSRGFTVERTAELLEVDTSKIFSSSTYGKGFSKHYRSILPQGNFRSSEEFETYERLAKGYQERLVDIKYRTQIGRWNSLGIDLERLYYERTFLVVRPVCTRENEGINFKDDSFGNEITTHLEFILREFDVEGKFKVYYTNSQNGVNPLVRIGTETIEDRAFLAVYWRVLRQDVREDLFSWGSPTRSPDIFFKNNSRMG